MNMMRKQKKTIRQFVNKWRKATNDYSLLIRA